MTPVPLPDTRRLAVLGDCHIHPDKGLAWPPAVLRAVSGADLIVTLGDMGEASGLDSLAALAPLIGVRGRDDAEDERTAAALRVLQLGELRIGCVFDPTEHGLASRADPFAPVAGWTATARALFGGPIHVLLYASTHRANVAEQDGLLIVNPGSAVLPADGAAASFAWLSIDEGKPRAEFVLFDDSRPA